MYATGIHGFWEHAPDKFASMPGGAEWLAKLGHDRPPEERHLAVHEGHLVAISGRDQALVDAAGADILARGSTGAEAQIRERLAAAASRGVAEVVIMAAGAGFPVTPSVAPQPPTPGSPTAAHPPRRPDRAGAHP